jgi:hypothetical protein
MEVNVFECFLLLLCLLPGNDSYCLETIVVCVSYIWCDCHADELLLFQFFPFLKADARLKRYTLPSCYQQLSRVSKLRDLARYM